MKVIYLKDILFIDLIIYQIQSYKGTKIHIAKYKKLL